MPVIQLVPFEKKHSENTRQWSNTPALMRVLDRARPVAEAEHDTWFNTLHQKSDLLYFAVEVEGQHIGNVWLYGIDWRHRRAELRIMIGDANFQGQGYGTASIDALCRYAFERLNIHKIYAYVLDINPAAKRSFEKAAFNVEGQLRADRWFGDHYCDVFLLARIQPE